MAEVRIVMICITTRNEASSQISAEGVEVMSNHKLSVWYHPIYTNGIHPDARFPRDRYIKLVDKLNTPEYSGKFIIKQPTQASRNELIIAHDPDYVDNFLNQNLTEKEIKRIGLTPWTPQIIPRTLL